MFISEEHLKQIKLGIKRAEELAKETCSGNVSHKLANQRVILLGLINLIENQIEKQGYHDVAEFYKE